MNPPDIFSSRLLSRATSVKDTSKDVLERLKLLGCRIEYVDKIVVEQESKLPKDSVELWKRRGIKVNSMGVIYVKFSRRPVWYSHPFNFDVR